MTDGKWLSADDEGVVIGSSLASSLDLETGDYITIECSGNGGFAETFDAVVQGIFMTEDYVVNKSQIYMAQDYLDSYLALDGAVTEIQVQSGKNRINESALKNNVSKVLSSIPSLESYTWKEVNPDLVAVANGDKGSSYVILFFLFIVATAGIINTMTMAVMERRKECAMMRAIGFSKGMISRLLSLEGLLEGFFGSLIGLIIAVLVNWPLASRGLDFTGMMASDIDLGYRVSLIFRSAWFTESFILIPLAAMLLSAFAAYIPIRKLCRPQIAEMFRRS